MAAPVMPAGSDSLVSALPPPAPPPGRRLAQRLWHFCDSSLLPACLSGRIPHCRRSMLAGQPPLCPTCCPAAVWPPPESGCWCLAAGEAMTSSSLLERAPRWRWVWSWRPRRSRQPVSTWRSSWARRGRGSSGTCFLGTFSDGSTLPATALMWATITPSCGAHTCTACAYMYSLATPVAAFAACPCA